MAEPGLVKHTTAAEMEAFLSKTPAAQNLDIWIAAKETNGAVAANQLRIAELGLEVQKARIDHSTHIETHVTAEELKLIRGAGSFRDLLADRAAMVEQVRTMWQWFTFGRIVVGIVMALQPFEIAIIGWWLVHR